MKKLIVVVLLLVSVISCGTSKTVRTSKKVIKGEWTLNSVTYNQTGTYAISLLNDASKECFEGSAWQFIPNNNTGIYTIEKGDCFPGERNFVFTIQEVDPETGLYDFLLKPTNEKNKSEDNKGFRLQLAELSEGSMTWVQTLNVNGKPFKINMNFTKTIE
ncbi:lipocalin family protein [Lutibacter sp.]|uniref:lipocalin family protein n=1 Tax=Lutibacter sp. TaxID=1925666 RepID=UPI001A35BAF0|nr:lipocalin family protein [Lutibacter sp.]MBI9042324.1 lipocalin family protein [Lutibacter sp.]